jgi:hypothetical protein
MNEEDIESDLVVVVVEGESGLIEEMENNVNGCSVSFQLTS